MMAEARKFELAISPHVASPESTRRIMTDVVLALLPALAAAVYFFGFRALLLTGISVLAAVVTEALCLRFMKKPVNIVLDGSAVVTGILLAYNVPPSVPWWLPIVGSAFAIAVAKQAFGGLGHNIVNPALLGRAFLMASFPVLMTAGWWAPMEHGPSGDDTWDQSGIPTARLEESDVATGATPLNLLKQTYDWDAGASEADAADDGGQARELRDRAAGARRLLSSRETLISLFLGRSGGCVGETSALMLLLGAVYLFLRKVLEPRLPLSYLGAVALFAWLFGGPGAFQGDPLFHLLSGGVVLGGFFMITDMVTTPVTRKGRIIFGIGAGLITMIIRRWGGYPEGCSYSILLMNLTTPLIDRYTKPGAFGEVKKNG
jgi:electron transport complex protein RnfD